MKYGDWFISYSVNPGLFWCQLQESTDTLDKLMEGLNAEYGSLGPGDRRLKGTPHVGQPCCALYSDDDNWYRAVVTAVNGNMATVHLVDYGNNQYVEVGALKVLSDQYCTLPAQAFPCSLVRVRPMGDTWSPAAISRFGELTDKETVTGTIINVKHDGCYGVELLSKNGVLIHKTLFQEGLAVGVLEGQEGLGVVTGVSIWVLLSF